jgi:hypothetical protein
MCGGRKMKIINSIEELKKFDFSNDVKIVGINNSIIKITKNITIILENSSPTVEANSSSSPTVVANDNSSPTVEAYNNSSPRVEANDNSSPTVVAYNNSSPRVVANDTSSPRVVANSSSSPTVVANDTSSPTVEAYNNSSPTVEAYNNSSPRVVANDTSSPRVEANSSSSPTVVANDNSSPTVEANSSSSPTVVANDTSSPRVEANNNSSPTVVANDNSKINHIGKKVSVMCYANSLFVTQNKEFKPDQHIIIQPDNKYDFFERHGIEKSDTYILYKKVSKDFKTQENSTNETLWLIGTIVTHKGWKPQNLECGEGKFHATSKPYFADRFRDERGDRYIAIQIKAEDLYEWKDNPAYPHKIGFREGIVLYECDIDGKVKDGD